MRANKMLTHGVTIVDGLLNNSRASIGDLSFARVWFRSIMIEPTLNCSGQLRSLIANLVQEAENWLNGFRDDGTRLNLALSNFVVGYQVELISR
jgi:hypothetical protein